MSSVNLCDSVPAYRSLQRVPLPAVRAAASLGAPQAAGPFLRAYRACAPAPARARLAPARFAHLIARARRRTHFARPFPPGLFSAPAAFLRRKAERRPPGTASPLPSYTTFSPVKPPGGENVKIFPERGPSGSKRARPYSLNRRPGPRLRAGTGGVRGDGQGRTLPDKGSWNGSCPKGRHSRIPHRRQRKRPAKGAQRQRAVA